MTLTSGTYCSNHIPKEKPRLNANQRGYTYQWSKASKHYLTSNPWCVECLKKGIHEPATETDHIIPHKGDKKLFWDKTNWQGLCHGCHSAKTAREDGGFKNRITSQKKMNTPTSCNTGVVRQSQVSRLT